jgi:hypothetical protein
MYRVQLYRLSFVGAHAEKILKQYRGIETDIYIVIAVAFSFSPCNSCESLIGCQERDMAIWGKGADVTI